MAEYWTSDHTEAIKEYYYATTQEDRCRVIDRILHKPLFEIASRCLTNLGLYPELEWQQDIVLHLIYKAMPRLTEDKLQGAFQYLWISAKNYTITYIIKPEQCRQSTTAPVKLEYVTSCTVDAVNLDEAYERERFRKKILGEIDSKIKGQQIINTTNSVFLLLLRDYLVEHDMDVRGFGPYVMERMHLKLSTFRAIAGRLNLRTKYFKEKI